MHRETITYLLHKNDLSLVCRQSLKYNVKKNKTELTNIVLYPAVSQKTEN